jgi:hypothetical protein
LKQKSQRPRAWPLLALFLWLSGLFAVPVTEAQALSRADPWDVSWLPDDRQGKRALDRALDELLQDTGLRGRGATIRENAQRHEVNPAFALAMFRQEAGFASRGTLALKNKNPANIVATGECWGKAEGARCQGLYGEVGTDGRFGRYASMADGIEAFFVLMAREYAGMRIHDLIDHACPPSECDVPGYVARVERWTVDYQERLIGVLYPEDEFEGVVLDDRSGSFWRRGPAEYWHQSEDGYAGHMLWTRNNQERTENAGRWLLELEQPGTYALYAYIPPLHATTRQGRYSIYCGTKLYETTIDQFAHRNQWVLLGRVRCSATGDEYVELSDGTGEPSLEREIAFDAIGVRLLRSSSPAKVTPPPTSEPRAGGTSPYEPDALETPLLAEQPVLLARLWSTAQRLLPFCCGGGVLVLILGVLGIVLWSKLPLGQFR